VTPSAALSEVQLRALREYVHAYNKHNAAAVAALYADDAVFLERGELLSGGVDTIEANYKSHFETFPDTTLAITRSWHKGNLVVFEYVETGTETGGVKPARKKYGYAGASVLRFRADGLIEKDDTYADELTKAVQLGWATGAMTMKMRPFIEAAPVTDAWEVHARGENQDVSKLDAASKGLYSNFAIGSESSFTAGLADDIVLAAYDEPKDAKGKREVADLFKGWSKQFANGVVDGVEAWTVDGHVLMLGTFTGKHVGAWGTVKPTNKTFKTHFLDIVRVNSTRKVDRLWSYANNYELLRQLGYENKKPASRVR
jgi:ketosteroid isomerase-like protein